MCFQISGLPATAFVHLNTLSDRQLREQNICKRTANSASGFPCRVSLQDAQQGETVFLLNFVHQDTQGPYRSSHAIYVRKNAKQSQLAPAEIPKSIRDRLLSVRGFDVNHMMLEADVVEGTLLAPLIAQFWENPDITYLHLHNARPGCFAARVDRV